MVFRQKSIREKLFWLMVLNGSLVLLLVGLGAFVAAKIDSRDAAKRELSSQAGTVADTIAAALAFSDDRAATDTLSALRADPDIVQAAVYSKDGRLFAEYVRAGSDAGSPAQRAPAAGTYLERRYVSMACPIRFSGETTGTVFLKSSLEEADRRLRRNTLLMCLVLLFSLALSVLLSARMQISITRPIADLSRVARSVSVEKNFSARAVKSENDEIGFLVDSFNQMLSWIESRDQALRESEERYALAARGSNDGLWDWKLASDEIYFSARWNQMLGYEEAESRGKSESWFRRVHPADHDRVKAEIAAHRDGRTTELITEYRIRQKSGGYMWVQSRGIAVRDENGTAVRMAGSQTDITKGKVGDPLTGLPNRLYFLDRLEGALEADRRKKVHSAVLFLDLDRFKLVNDSMGHAAGDALLEGVADRLRQSIAKAQREGEADAASFVARLGGDEFAVLLNRITRSGDATKVAGRILEDLTAPFHIGGRQVFAGSSIGVALTSPGDTAEELLRNADTAMYYAKTSGKSRFAVFDESMREQAVERLEIETDLRKAVGDGQMRLQFQPQVSIADRRLTGFEALARWKHPVRGMIPPGEFIPIAEDTALIVPIGQWVLRDACRQMAAWQARTPMVPSLTVAVNVSFLQLTSTGFVDEVRGILQETGLSPSSLRLEMTESAVMKDPQESIETLRRLKEVGVGLEIDDFGTGYSSLSYLSCLPIDTVKIDRSFVSGLGSREESGELVKTIVELARSLSLDVVAEGVETEMQLEKLRQLDCARAQGYYFSRPVDSDCIPKMIEDECLRRGFRALNTGSVAAAEGLGENQSETNLDVKEMKIRRSGGNRRPQAVGVAIIIAVLGAGVRPARAQNSSPNIANASIEDLMNMDVTSVSKKDQTLSRTGAAVYVIGREDIRRSGAANIPDLLRMAPGVEVAQINANQWAISIRGFNAVYSNKVLVLIDGRSVYVDQFSGVFWDQIDVPLEDIERIEVIRGPGGTVWGANAVNGVINIITASAADTKGGLAVAAAGSSQSAAGLLQYGGDLGSKGAYRVFGKYFNDQNSPMPGLRSAGDGAHNIHGGFRVDLGLTANDTVSVQGDFLNEAAGEPSVFFTTAPTAQISVTRLLPDSSGDLLAQWDHTFSNGSESTLRVSDGAVNRIEYADRLFDNDLDVEFEHHLKFGARQDVVWGLDYRSITGGVRAVENLGIYFSPARRVTNLFAGFVQDEIRIGPALFLTVGSKVEHNAYTGFEYEPGVQLVWAKSARHSLWASAARSIREPDSSERDVRGFGNAAVPLPPLGEAIAVVNDNPSVRAEVLNDYEIGYRTQVNSRVSLDVTGFLSYYANLLTYEAGSLLFSSEGIVIPETTANRGKARDYGVEAFGGWQAARKWKISPGVSLLRMRPAGNPSTLDSGFLAAAGDSPREQFEIRSLLDPRRNIEWDSSLKYVTALPALGVPAYARLDMRLGWKVGEHAEVSVTGQNLTSGRHFEFNDVSHLYTASEVARSVFGKLTWRF